MATDDGSRLRVRIEQHLPLLTDASRRVAAVLLDEGVRIGFLSATEIGHRAATSDATVVRTAQRLGYGGLDDLKESVARELLMPTPGERLRTTLDAAAEHHDDPVRGFLMRRADDLGRLAASDLDGSFEAAVACIVEASRVFVDGIGPTAPIAAYGAALLARTGVDARVLSGSGSTAADDIASIHAGDAVVVLAYAKPASHVMALFDHAAETQAAVVLVTDAIPPPSGRSATLQVGRGDPSGVASHVATVATLEAVALAVAAADPERASSTLDTVTRLRRTIAGVALSRRSQAE